MDKCLTCSILRRNAAQQKDPRMGVKALIYILAASKGIDAERLRTLSPAEYGKLMIEASQEYATLTKGRV